MSDPITALKGASDSTGIATVSEMGPQGMITLRGDLSDKTLVKAAAAAGGVAVPEARQINTDGQGGIAWMTPDELLILCPYAEAHDRLADLQGKIAKQHALAVNVSDARAMFRVEGDAVREVVAKLAPVDMSPDHFQPGMIRRTRFAQVPGAFWMPTEGVVQVICFRSVAQYMYDLLNVAGQKGSAVGLY